MPGVCAVVTTNAGVLSPDKARFIDLVECGGRARPSLQHRISAFVDGHTIRLEDATGPDCEDEHVFLVQQNGENGTVRVDRPKRSPVTRRSPWNTGARRTGRRWTW